MIRNHFSCHKFLKHKLLLFLELKVLNGKLMFYLKTYKVSNCKFENVKKK